MADRLDYYTSLAYARAVKRKKTFSADLKFEVEALPSPTNQTRPKKFSLTEVHTTFFRQLYSMIIGFDVRISVLFVGGKTLDILFKKMLVESTNPKM